MNKNEKNEERTALSPDELDAVSGGARAADCVHEWVEHEAEGYMVCMKCGATRPLVFEEEYRRY